jgi:hypothetical protein
VQSGYRLLLTYDLHYSGAATGSDRASIEESARLRGLFASWMKIYQDSKEPGVLLYRLQHPATAKLCYDHLEGDDQKVVMRLKEACSETGFHLYLANVERTVSGCCEDEYDYYGGYHPRHGYRRGAHEEDHHEMLEVGDTTTELKEVNDLQGNAVAKDIRIEEKEIIQDDLFEEEPGRDPDKEDYDGDALSHYYRERVTTSQANFSCMY